jgi:hypothetical protein
MQDELILSKFLIATVLGVLGFAAAILVTFLQARSKRQLLESDAQNSIVNILELITSNMAKEENLILGDVKADIFLLDSKEEVLKQAVSSRKNRDLKDKVIEYQKQKGIIGRVLADKAITWVDFPTLNHETSSSSILTPQEKELFKDMKSLLGVPILQSETNEPVGVLFIYTKEKV